MVMAVGAALAQASVDVGVILSSGFWTKTPAGVELLLRVIKTSFAAGNMLIALGARRAHMFVPCFVQSNGRRIGLKSGAG